jgi:TPP-dependent 2-oxoacid decarboxylase
MYQGIMTPGYIRQRVENADGILCIGTLMTDANLGGFSAKLNEDKLVQAINSEVKVQNRIYEDVFLKEFLGRLISEVSSGNPEDYDINNAGFSYYDRGTREYEPVPKKKRTQFLLILAGKDKV